MHRPLGARRFLSHIFVGVTLSVASSCGGDQSMGPTTPDATVATVEVDAERQSVSAIGDTVGLIAVARDENGQIIHGQSFWWASSNKAVATVDPQTGLVTAVGSGISTITASAGAVAGSLVFTVEQLVDRVSVQPSNLTLTSIGAWTVLAATARDANGHVVSDKVFEWVSSDSNTVKVDAGGRVIAAANGIATIWATVNGMSGEAIVEVDQLSVTVLVTPASDTLRSITDTVRVSAEVLDGAGNRIEGAHLSWSSSTPSVASVDSTGLVTAVGNGTAVVEVAAGLASGSAIVTVQQVAVLLSIADHRDTLVAIGDTVRLTATAYDNLGLTLENPEFAWKSTVEDIATVDEAGLVSASANGSFWIVAEEGGVADTAIMQVQQRVATIEIEPAELFLTRGDTAQLSAAGFDLLGNVVPDVTWTWSSTNEALVTVNQGGSVQVGLDASAGDEVLIQAKTMAASGTTQLRVTPEFHSVVGGQDHTCGITQSGAAYCWGRGYGLTPSPVGEGIAFDQIAAGGDRTCGLTSEGSTYCWGVGGAPGSKLSGDLDFTAISVGRVHICALTGAMEAYCWGDNSLGQVGDSTVIEPYGVPHVGTPTLVSGGHTFRAITAGNHHSCAIDESNAAFCWGYNDRGQTGQGSGNNLGVPSYPRPVYGTHSFDSITTRYNHTCALDTSGRAFCWGYNGVGQIGNGVVGGSGGDVRTPAMVTGGLVFESLETGADHTCGLTAEAKAFCWGQGDRLGDGSYDESAVPRPVPVNHDLQYLGGGEHATFGIDMEGKTHGWGYNFHGEIGSGDTQPARTPVLVIY